MINKAVILGRMAVEPELKSTNSGTAVVNFCVAVDRQYQPSGSAEKVVDFIDCSAYGTTAEFLVRNFRKGQPIALDGHIETSTYAASDGGTRKSFRIKADNISFAGDKKQTETYEEIE